MTQGKDDMPGHGSLQAWIAQSDARWSAVAEQLPALQDNKPVDLEHARAALRAYPELARDVALARQFAPRSRVAGYVESLYAGLHRAIYRAPKLDANGLRMLWLVEIPGIARSLRSRIVVLTVLFFLTGAAGWWLVAAYPELVRLFAGEALIDTVKRGELWTDGLLNIMPSSVLAAQIFTNNIVVCLTAMSLGVLYGIGTLYIVSLNGLMLGGIFAFTAAHGLADRLLVFILAHGPVELTVIFIASAIGFSIGESLARPGHLRRGEAFRRAVNRGMKLMLLCIVFLIGAGLIEGYVSPNPSISPAFKAATGIVFWCVLMLALAGWRLPWRAKAGAGVSGGGSVQTPATAVPRVG